MHRDLINRAVGLLVPPRCAACAAATEPSAWICFRCRGELERMPIGRSDQTCFAAFPHRAEARSLVAALKFEGAVAVAEELAELMRPRLPTWFAEADWLVPAPPHPARRRARGYNQSLLLARALAQGTELLVVDCLRRAEVAPPQSQLSRARRLQMPASAITVDERAIRQHTPNSLAVFPTNVVVCDDVVTTGVTLEVCAQAIRERHHPTGSVLARSVSFASAGRQTRTSDRIAPAPLAS
ncbi:MAG: ComF family protein [Thermoleophilaceae bacterium]|nr:ComF family protein [Thermoleophilaceae bacterium]